MARYRILQKLGEGGMGIVNVAHDETLGRKVALKQLSPAYAENVQFRERFVRESRLAASIDHPNIIPVYEAGEDEQGTLFIAMRLVRGRDLRQVLRGEGPLAPERAVALVGQVASALDAAHGVGLVHRDVKPGNVMIDATAGGEHCYLTDFGLVKDLSVSSGYTVTGAPLGTLTYMAPEQIEGFRLDGRADQYALGCMLFECLTGSAPFVRDQAVALMYAHMHDPPPSACAVRPELPPGVDSVLMRAMAKAAGDRYASCCEMVLEMRRALAGQPMPEFVATRRVSRRFSRPPGVEPAPPSVQSPAVDLLPPANGNGNGHRPGRAYAPPPRTSLPPRATPDDQGRRWLRAAVILACAILLTAGGITAALVLSSKDSSETASKRVAAEKLVQRTLQLDIELTRELRALREDGKADAATRRRIKELQHETEVLAADSRRELGTSSATAKFLLSAQEDLTKAAGEMAKVAAGRPLRGWAGRTEGRLGSARKKAEQAGAANGAGAPREAPLPSRPVAAPPVTKSSVQLPGDELATIKPPSRYGISRVTPVGDVSGDGTGDFALEGVSQADGGPPTAWVVFGGNDADKVDLGALGDDGFEIAGARSVAPAGDLDGDGNADVAALGSSAGTEGKAFVVEGKDDGRPVNLLDSAGVKPIELSATEQPDSVEDELSGVAVRGAGDVDNDGTDDVIVGDPFANGGEGGAWVVFGDGGDDPVSVDSLTGADGFAITSSDGGNVGAWVDSAGDVNNDGTDDVIVGSPYEGAGGAAHVVFGTDDPADVDLADLGDEGFAITTGESGAQTGAIVAGPGDVDGDGTDDVLVTAPRSSPDGRTEAGAAYVVFGEEGDSAADEVRVDDLEDRGFAISGPAASTYPGAQNTLGFGSSASPAGEVNGDDHADVVIGAGGLRDPAALAYVVYGSDSGDTVDLRAPDGRALAIEGRRVKGAGPIPVAGNGDFDDDGTPDILVAPPVPGDEPLGAAYVLPGAP